MMTQNTFQPQWLNEISWGMIHEDAVTRFLEWGNNNYHDHMRAPVTYSGDYSIYFALDTWETPLQVVLMRMDNWGAKTMWSTPVPEALASEYLADMRGLKGIFELTPAIEEWLRAELEKTLPKLS